MDLNHLIPFPYPEDFNDKDATLQSLKSVYRKYVFENVESMMKTENIQKIYVGDIFRCYHYEPWYSNTALYFHQAILLKFKNAKYMTLNSFLEGENVTYITQKVDGECFVDYASLQEKTLEEAKNLYYMKKENRNRQK